MSDTGNKAVFLSCASQDAAAVARIAANGVQACLRNRNVILIGK